MKEMNKLDLLRNEIEAVRAELNETIVSQDFKVYYAKSVELDNLIANYVELEG